MSQFCYTEKYRKIKVSLIGESIMNKDIHSVEMSVLLLVQRFVERQRITFDAIKALRPALVEAAHINLSQEKLVSILSRYMDEPWQGHWHEWTYHFQGAGCRLINDETREIIEWQARDIETFDRYWFVNWIEWLFKFHPDDEDLVLLNAYYLQQPHRHGMYEVIFPMLKLLHDEAYLAHNDLSDNVYTLITQSSAKADIA